MNKNGDREEEGGGDKGGMDMSHEANYNTHKKKLVGPLPHRTARAFHPKEGGEKKCLWENQFEETGGKTGREDEMICKTRRGLITCVCLPSREQINSCTGLLKIKAVGFIWLHFMLFAHFSVLCRPTLTPKI